MSVASLWLLPSPQSRDRIVALQRDINATVIRVPSFAPHVTLEVGTEHLLAPLVDKIACTTSKFSVKIERALASELLFKTCYLQFERAPFAPVRNVLLAEMKTAYEFDPHMSITYNSLSEFPLTSRLACADSIIAKLLAGGKELEISSIAMVRPRNGVDWELIHDWEMVRVRELGGGSVL
jgi:hypothetical protein